MKKKYFDCIILGVGGIGSAACYFAAKKGWSVLGIEQFQAANDRGSSHGLTRIIRQAYFEHPSYVPLVLRAYHAWNEIEQVSNSTLFHQTGLLQIGWPDNEVIRGVLSSANEHNLAVEQLTAEQCAERFPQFVIPNDQIGVYESSAGYLLVEQCVQTMIDLAIEHEAEILCQHQVRSFDFEDNRFVVDVDGQSYESDRLVVTAGAWSNSLLSDLDISLKVVRKHQHWFQFQNQEQFRDCPVYLIETKSGYFYGFPNVAEKGFKVAEHTGGEIVLNPSDIDRAPSEQDLERVSQFVAERLRADQPTHDAHSVCMYTLSDDEHFVIDRHPEIPRLVFACGMSGHGFKFTPVIGEHLIELLDNPEHGDSEFDFLKLRNGK